MTAPFANQHTTVLAEVTDQILSLHDVRLTSS